MTSKLEECARAQRFAAVGVDNWIYMEERDKQHEIDAMRAALQVLREPDEAMEEAGYARLLISRAGVGSTERNIWQAMIDAVLQEGE